MKIRMVLAFLAVIAFSAAVAAQGSEFEEAKSLIDSNVSCSELSDSQLEEIGDYYMEQMHPGELHEIMDERMGGEGSESLRQVHIAMAKYFYCGDSSAMYGYGMMGMIGSGMMGYYNNGGGMMNGYGNYGYGMSGSFGLYNILLVLLIVLAILGIIWLAKQIAAKPANGKNIKRR